jgi:hypothetical protein
MIGKRQSLHGQGAVGDTCSPSASKERKIPQKLVAEDVDSLHIEGSPFEAQTPGRPHVHCPFLNLVLSPLP